MTAQTCPECGGKLIPVDVLRTPAITIHGNSVQDVWIRHETWACVQCWRTFRFNGGVEERTTKDAPLEY